MRVLGVTASRLCLIVVPLLNTSHASTEKWIGESLADLGKIHQRRTLATFSRAGGKIDADGQTLLNFASNDYLDLLNHPRLKAAAAEAARTFGAGSGASRLVSGSLEIHERLEAEMARHKGYPAALLFGSGYMTNTGVVPALCGRNDVVLADRLAHASLIDAVRLSGAKLIRFRHNDAADLAHRLETAPGKGRRLVITESVFSMDGDLAPLPDMALVAEQHGAMLLVDEAHATGIWGTAGRGLVAEHHLQEQVNVSMSTFSKALGSYGGIATCSIQMRDWLINTARSFIYTTAPPPASCGAALAALELLAAEPNLGTALLERANSFRSHLHERGFDTGPSKSQIVPVIVGDNEATMSLATRLRENNIMVAAIRPPTVPAGTSRLRFSITLAHREEDLLHAANILSKCAAPTRRAALRR